MVPGRAEVKAKDVGPTRVGGAAGGRGMGGLGRLGGLIGNAAVSRLARAYRPPAAAAPVPRKAGGGRTAGSEEEPMCRR